MACGVVECAREATYVLVTPPTHPVIECVVSPCGHIADIPVPLQMDWARAQVEVFDHIRTAQLSGDALALERALKWEQPWTVSSVNDRKVLLLPFW